MGPIFEMFHIFGISHLNRCFKGPCKNSHTNLFWKATYSEVLGCIACRLKTSTVPIGMHLEYFGNTVCMRKSTGPCQKWLTLTASADALLSITVF